MKKQNIVSLAIGSAVASLAFSPVAHAADNPFGATKLEAGYQLAQADTKMKDANCGANKKAAEAKCGADKKAAEAKAAADKKKDGACGGDKKKDGSCGAKK